MCASVFAPPTRPLRRGDRGFALAISIFALVIIAALIVGAFFAARQEMRLGINSRTSVRALGAAEAGLNTTVANWQTGTWNMLSVGDSAAFSGTLASNGGSYAGWVRRLNTQLFLIRSTGADPQTLVQRTLAAFTRLQLIQMNFAAALTVRGATSVTGSSLLDGRDTPPSGWTECPTTGLDTLPGMTMPTTSGSSIDLGNITGDPKVVTDPTINDSTFFKYGDLDWNELVAMATKVYPAGNVGPLNHVEPVGTATTCSTGTLDNWGDPLRSAGTRGCWNYFPIIYVNGDLKMTGGYGQGILLVTGDMEVAGGAEFYGPVIILGHLKSTGTGGHFNGGVMAANVSMEDNLVSGNSLIAYSSCALANALRASAPGRLVRERSWVEVF
jgi:Tfp pilus assembly protein PilX